LYGPAGEFVRRVTEKSEADPAGVLLYTLACSGLVLGRDAFYPHGYVKCRPCLFAVTVAQSPRTGQGCFLEPVRALFSLAAELSGTELLKFIPNGLLAADELLPKSPSSDARGLPSAGMGDFEPSWDTLSRARAPLTTALRHAWDEHTRIAILGHLTEPYLLAARATRPLLHTASRMLWCCVHRERSIALPQTLPPEGLRPIAEILASNAKRDRSPREMKFAPGTATEWEQAYSSLTLNDAGAVGIVTALAEAQVIRIAMVYALLDGLETINPAHMKAALAVWDYCRLSAQHLFGTGIGDALTEKLFRALGEKPLSRTEVHRLFNNHAPADRIDAALANLAKEGRAISEVIKTEGRPRTVWKQPGSSPT
jgi:hypothetical protein